MHKKGKKRGGAAAIHEGPRTVSSKISHHLVQASLSLQRYKNNVTGMLNGTYNPAHWGQRQLDSEERTFDSSIQTLHEYIAIVNHGGDDFDELKTKMHELSDKIESFQSTMGQLQHLFHTTPRRPYVSSEKPHVSVRELIARREEAERNGRGAAEQSNSKVSRSKKSLRKLVQKRRSSVKSARNAKYASQARTFLEARAARSGAPDVNRLTNMLAEIEIDDVSSLARELKKM